MLLVWCLMWCWMCHLLFTEHKLPAARFIDASRSKSFDFFFVVDKMLIIFSRPDEIIGLRPRRQNKREKSELKQDLNLRFLPGAWMPLGFLFFLSKLSKCLVFSHLRAETPSDEDTDAQFAWGREVSRGDACNVDVPRSLGLRVSYWCRFKGKTEAVHRILNLTPHNNWFIFLFFFLVHWS